jgi:hypothetical protein
MYGSLPVRYLGDIHLAKLAIAVARIADSLTPPTRMGFSAHTAWHRVIKRRTPATMNRILAAAAEVEIRSPIGKLYRTR